MEFLLAFVDVNYTPIEFIGYGYEEVPQIHHQVAQGFGPCSEQGKY
jgi:hypothetical protein